MVERYHSPGALFRVAWATLVLFGLTTPAMAIGIAPGYLAEWHDAMAAEIDAEIVEGFARKLELEITLAELARRIDQVRKSTAVQSMTEARNLSARERIERANLEMVEERIERDQKTRTAIDEILAAQVTHHVARVTVARGEVYVASAGRRRAVDPSTMCQSGDLFETGRGGFLEFVATDGSLIQLDQNSRLELHFTSSGRSIYTLLGGRTHGMFRCLARTGNECRPTGFSGGDFAIRGAGVELNLQINPDGEQRFFALGGTGYFTGPDRSEVALDANTMMQVTADGMVAGPLYLAAEWVLRWWE